MAGCTGDSVQVAVAERPQIGDYRPLTGTAQTGTRPLPEQAVAGFVAVADRSLAVAVADSVAAYSARLAETYWRDCSRLCILNGLELAVGFAQCSF